MEFHQTLQTHSYLQDKNIIKTLELGANTIGVISLCNSNDFCIDSFLNILKSH